jgi:hypothetical protein
VEFGFADPLVVNADMTIIGGHQRLNVRSIWLHRGALRGVDVRQDREKALNIALNKIKGEWDERCCKTC